MSSNKNPFDLNNFPDEYTVSNPCERRRDSKQFMADSSIHTFDASKCNKRKCGADEGKETCGKVYECRFCSLKFCKSTALGGHMNRHRQERETETLNRARQLVYGNDSLAALNIGLREPSIGAHVLSGNSHHDPFLSYTSSFTTRSSVPNLSQSLPSFLYPPMMTAPPPPTSPPPSSWSSTSLPSSTSSCSHHLLPFHSSHRLTATPLNDYIVGHVMDNSTYRHQEQRNSSNMVVGIRDFPSAGNSMGQENEGSLCYQDEQQVGPLINRFQGDF